MGSGRIIKPGQIFFADEIEIPESFRHCVIRLDGRPEPEPEPVQVPPLVAVPVETGLVEENQLPEPMYKMVPRGLGWWNIVNLASGKILNEKALRQAEALKMIQELQ